MSKLLALRSNLMFGESFASTALLRAQFSGYVFSSSEGERFAGCTRVCMYNVWRKQKTCKMSGREEKIKDGKRNGVIGC